MHPHQQRLRVVGAALHRAQEIVAALRDRKSALSIAGTEAAPDQKGVIGDKKGGASTLKLGSNPDLLHRLRETVDIDVKFMHVVNLLRHQHHPQR